MGYTLEQVRRLTIAKRGVRFPLRERQTHGNVGAQSCGSHPSSGKGTRVRSPLLGFRQPGCRTRRPGFYVMHKRNTYEINLINIKYLVDSLGERGNAFVEYFVLALIVLGATIWFFDGGNFQGVRQNVETTFTNLITKVAQ